MTVPQSVGLLDPRASQRAMAVPTGLLDPRESQPGLQGMPGPGRTQEDLRESLRLENKDLARQVASVGAQVAAQQGANEEEESQARLHQVTAAADREEAFMLRSECDKLRRRLWYKGVEGVSPVDSPGRSPAEAEAQAAKAAAQLVDAKVLWNTEIAAAQEREAAAARRLRALQEQLKKLQQTRSPLPAQATPQLNRRPGGGPGGASALPREVGEAAGRAPAATAPGYLHGNRAEQPRTPAAASPVPRVVSPSLTAPSTRSSLDGTLPPSMLDLSLRAEMTSSMPTSSSSVADSSRPSAPSPSQFLLRNSVGAAAGRAPPKAAPAPHWEPRLQEQYRIRLAGHDHPLDN